MTPSQCRNTLDPPASKGARECRRPRPAPRYVHDAVDYATLERSDWFNHRGLLAPTGHVPPAEREAANYRRKEESAMGDLTQTEMPPEKSGRFSSLIELPRDMTPCAAHPRPKGRL